MNQAIKNIRMINELNANEEKAIQKLKKNPFQPWNHNKHFFTAKTIIEKYKTFMTIQATASQLAEFYAGSGVDFRGSSKARIAESITNGTYAGFSFMSSDRYGYEALVRRFGVRS